MTVTTIILRRENLGIITMYMIASAIMFFLNRSAMGQTVYDEPTMFKGFEASFGTRSFAMTSDIPELSNLTVVEEGGSFGILYGTDRLRVKLRAIGFYNSTDKIKRTINAFETEGIANFYPLQMGKGTKTKVEPYVLAGIAYNQFKLYGHYLHTSEGQPVNYSDSREPLLGKIVRAMGTVGAGIEWRLVNSFEFIHLFTEIKCTQPLYEKTNETMFANTNIRNCVAVNVGVNFGIYY